MASTSKRPRYDDRPRYKARRPVDKFIVNIIKNTVGTTQQSTLLYTATYPGTMQGIHIDLVVQQDAGVSAGSYQWAIVILRDGATLPLIASSDGSSLIQPEQDCLLWGRGFNNRATNDSPKIHYQMSTKTMRRMMDGDEIYFIFRGAATNTSKCEGAVMGFYKT